MDPNAAWKAALDGDQEAAEALVGWLARGGFPPSGKTADEVLLWIRLTYGIVLETDDG